MKFFKPPLTKEHIEEQYKILCKKLHPDKGGNKEDFNKMIDEKILILEVLRFSSHPKELPRIRMRKKPRVILKGRVVPISKFNIDETIDALKKLKKLFK